VGSATKDVVLAALVTRPGQLGGNRQRRHGCPGIANDIVPVMVRRAEPAAPATHQVDELAGDGRIGRAFTHRRTGAAGVPGIRHRVVFPGLAPFHQVGWGIKAADDIDLAVARIVDCFGPEAGGRHGRASGPCVRCHVIDVRCGQSHKPTIFAAEDINLVDVSGIRCPRIEQGNGQRSQLRPGVSSKIVAISHVGYYVVHNTARDIGIRAVGGNGRALKGPSGIGSDDRPRPGRASSWLASGGRSRRKGRCSRSCSRCCCCCCRSSSRRERGRRSRGKCCCRGGRMSRCCTRCGRKGGCCCRRGRVSCCGSSGRSWSCRWRRRNRDAGSDTHVVQEKETGRVEEYELQVSVGSGYHMGKCKLRIPKETLNRLWYESNTTKRSPEKVVASVVLVREPKAHVIRLACHGRDDLIKKTFATSWTGE